MSAAKQGEMRTVKVADIVEADLAIRKKVNREDLAFIQLRDSIANKGLLQPFSVREIENPADPTHKRYCQVDGLQRMTAIRDLGWDEVTVSVITTTGAESIELMIAANSQHVPTKAAEYMNGLKQMMALDKTLTIPVMAQRLNWSEDKLRGMLKLTDLEPSIQKLVDEGALPVLKAQRLAQLPVEKQAEFKDRAISMAGPDFDDVIKTELKSLKQAQQTGIAGQRVEFTPSPRFQTMANIQEERAKPDKLAALCMSNNVTTVSGAIQMTLDWVLQLDPVTVAEKKRVYDEQKAEAEKKKKERDAEKAKKKEEAQAAAKKEEEERLKKLAA